MRLNPVHAAQWPFHQLTHTHSTASQVPLLHVHTSQHTMLSSHFALLFQSSLAQQQHNSLLFAFASTPSPCFCLTTPLPHTQAQSSLHHIHYTSVPSKSLSFLLLITVVGPFELFKAARAARKTPSAPKRDDLSAERGRRGKDESEREGER